MPYVSISHEDIEDALDTGSHPMEFALRRMWPDASILEVAGFDRIAFKACDDAWNVDCRYVKLPREAREFNLEWVLDQNVKPLDFELDLNNCYIA